MAENIALRQEQKLPFYEELRSSGLYGDKNKLRIEDQEELKWLMKQEELLEGKINSSSKSVKHYYEFINFKKSLFTTISIRGKNSNAYKLKHLKYCITAHIRKLFVEGLNFFPQELALWEAYIKFCKVTRLYPDGSAAYEKMLLFHGDKPKYWLDAVQWECEETKNMEKAKNLLLSAIEKHPECPNVYLKMFEILLPLAITEQSPDYRLAMAVFNNSKNCDFQIDYWAKVLEITEEYAFTKKLQELVIGFLIDKFVTDELVWHLLAQRELKGFPTGKILKEKMEMKSNSNEADESEEMDEKIDIDLDKESNVYLTSYGRPSERNLELCSEIYQSALTVVNTEKMWTYYIDAMLELNKDLSTEKRLKWSLLEKAFRGALAAHQLNENHFRAYVDILRASEVNEEEIIQVIKKGTILYPNSTMPWQLYMCHHIEKNNETEVMTIFREACEALKHADLTYSLWRIILQYYQTLPDKYDYVYQIYSEVCNQTSMKFLPFRVHYLEIYMINKSVEEVRKLYDQLTLLSPPYLELHKKMASFESDSLNPDIDHWRKCHKNAVRFFGEERSDVWINFLKFEKGFGDPEKISEIYREACATLKDKSKFINEYNILNAMGKFD